MTAEAFMKLLKEGRTNEARKMLEAETVKEKFAPDTITIKKGRPVLTHRGKQVEQDAEGNWRLKVIP